MRIKTTLTLIALILSMVSVLGLGSGLSLAAVDCTQSNLNTHDAIQCGANGANGGASSAPSVNTLIIRVVNFLSAVIGIIAVIMIMIGGFRYVTSGGASEKVTNAKNTILYAVIGLVVVALAQVIARFVLNKVAHK
jgi:hypothetical protein